MKSATLSIALMDGRIFGIFGAGGSTGNLSSILGINDGNSGNCGGAGRTGIVGTCMSLKIARSRFPSIFKSISAVGGSGKLGNSGNGILIGTKLNLGKRISIPTSTWERSSVISGILNGGILKIGN